MLEQWSRGCTDRRLIQLNQRFGIIAVVIGRMGQREPSASVVGVVAELPEASVRRLSFSIPC